MLQSIRFGISISRSISYTPIRNGSARKVGKHGKPRWIPVAQSKQFKLPPQDRSTQEEKDQYDLLWERYRDHYSAVSQFLWDEHLKNSAVGEAAKLEVSRELEEQNRLILENDAENAKIAAKRKVRLEEEARLREEEIKAEIQIEEAKEEERLQRADAFISQETEEFKDRITSENLVLKIEEALDHPVDYEYAIDKEGHIYRGRYTKSILTPMAEREKIPVPKRENIYLEVRNS